MTSVDQSPARSLLNRVPEITAFFWIIKILGTTVGETAADFLNVNLNLGLTITSVVTGILLIVALFFQFKAKRYVPGIYWSAVVLISVFGTLVTDNLTDAIGVPLEASTIFFSVLLGLTFIAWYLKEKTLSIHSIVTGQREAFYWLAILFTFALGTAAGDLLAEGLGLGYFTTGVIVAVAIAAFALAWRMGLNSILAFWAIYILTRPLGASIGDLLSQPTKYGGLGLGATVTSALFIAGIVGAVIYLAISKKDVTNPALVQNEITSQGGRGGLWQTSITLALILVISGVGYHARQESLRAGAPVVTGTQDQEEVEDQDGEVGDATETDEEATAARASTSGTPAVTSPKPTATNQPSAASSPLGDLSSFRTITQDTLNLVNQGDLAGAKDRIGDLEYEWDNAEARLKPMNKAKWTEVDDAIDAALRQARAVKPNATNAASSLQALLSALK
ncbi:hypothetical protein KKH81_00905 [Patescibacteria group bacterium]|nr:hypothetical protein [Patescibacteria group bacterium]